MGEGTSHIEWAQEGPIQPSFNRSIHVEARPTRLSSDTGALMLRELLDHSGVVDWLDEHLQDQRTQDLITHPLPELLRTPPFAVGARVDPRRRRRRAAARSHPALVGQRSPEPVAAARERRRPAPGLGQPADAVALDRASGHRAQPGGAGGSGPAQRRVSGPVDRPTPSSPDLGGGHGCPADAGARAPGGGGVQRLLPRLGVPSLDARLGADRRVLRGRAASGERARPSRGRSGRPAAPWTGFSRTWPDR